MMAFPYDRTQVVEAQVVEKRTFLHLEPKRDATLKFVRRRCRTDTLVDYSSEISELESEGNSSTASPKSSAMGCLSELFSSSDSEESSSPPATDTYNDERLFTNQEITQLAHQSSFEATCNSAVAAASHALEFEARAADIRTAQHALELEARAADLRAKAARLEAAALQCVAVSQAPLASPCQGEPTTLMMRNIPNDYTYAMFLDLLDSKSLTGKYDFVYIPIDLEKMAGLGYAFVNFVSRADAEAAWRNLHGFNQWKIQSPKVCEVRWGELQGLTAHIDRYRDSPIMHRDVPENLKPILLQCGVRVAFPSPTRRIRAPRAKRNEVGMQA